MAAIEIAGLCKELGVLPRAGGLLDQDWYHVRLLKAGLYGIAKHEEYQQRTKK